jgi:hypothetical protein
MRRPRRTLIVVAALPETGFVAPHVPARQAPRALNVDLVTRTEFHSGVGEGFLDRVGHDGTVYNWTTVVLAGLDEYKSKRGSSWSFTFGAISPTSGLCIAPASGPGGVGTPSLQISCSSPTTTWASGHDTLKVANDGLLVDNDRAASNAGAAVDQRMCTAQINEGVIPT